MPLGRQRTSKYKRIGERDALPAHRWQDTDTLILQKVAEYRYTDTLILQKVAEYRYTTTAMLQAITSLSRSTINYRASKLFHHGYLGRRHLPHPHTDGGSSPSIHVLDYQGRTWLSQNTSVDNRHLRSIAPATTHSPTAERELEHSLLGSHVHAVIEATCNSNPHLRLDFWHNESKEYYTKVADDGLAHPVRPDAFSQMSVLEEGRWRPYPILWEFDRATMSHVRIRRKLRAYFVLWRDHLRPTGQLDQFENINRFRVATVTSKNPRSKIGDTETRLSNLVEDAHVADDHNIGSQLFLFTHLEDLPLTAPSDLLNPIWHVGHEHIKEKKPFVEI